MPTIVTRTNITRDHLDAVVATCRSLFRSKVSLKYATYHQHLLKLDRRDGLRLATAQMIISSSARACKDRTDRKCYLAGGDILRMAQNIIKFENLRTSTSIPRKRRSKFRVLTTSMEEHIASPGNNTLRFLDFVVGGNSSSSVPMELIHEAAMDFERSSTRVKSKAKSDMHVTQGKHDDREALHQYLRDDDVFGPVLIDIEKLVERALRL